MKKFLMLLAVSSMSLGAMAQTETEAAEKVQYDEKAVVTNGFWDNWFISGGVGASVLMGDFDKKADFGKRISPTINIAVGKWFPPGLGLRLQYSGLQAKGAVPGDNGMNYADGLASAAQLGGAYYKQKFNYMNLHADAMFNLMALFGGYNPDRVYELIPYAGFGFTHSYSTPHRHSMSVNGGLINRFRVSDAFDINLELSIAGFEDKFDAGIGGKGYDGVVSATVGVTYRFAKRGFDKPKPQLISESELALMRDKMNDLAAENKRLARELQDCKMAEPKVREVEVDRPDVTPRTVFFTIESAKVSKREAMNLSYLAETMKKYPDTKYVVNGYADSATGTAEYNQKLAQKRAEAVIKVLVDKYGIESDRLSVGKTEGVDTFGEPILNRVVLVEAQ